MWKVRSFGKLPLPCWPPSLRYGAPLFRSIDRYRRLTDNSMHRVDVWAMIKRRLKAAGLSPTGSCHTWRGSGITEYLRNGGNLETAQHIADHESARTTKLYDRTDEEVTLDEIEKIPAF